VAKLTLALPHVNSSVDGSPRGQDLCRITPNQTDQGMGKHIPAGTTVRKGDALKRHLKCI